MLVSCNITSGVQIFVDLEGRFAVLAYVMGVISIQTQTHIQILVGLMRKLQL